MPDRSTGTSDPVLAAAVSAVAHGADADDILAELIGLAAEVSGASMGAVFLWDADRGALALAGSVGVPDALLPVFEVAVLDPANPVARVAHERVVLRDAPMAFPDGPAFVAAWPIAVSRGGLDEPIGVLALAHAAPWSVADPDAARVAAIADLVGLGVDRAQAASMLAERSEWLERVAHSDALTGLANARTLGRVLELELARAARQGSEVSVAIFDVDGFGATNAAAGRAAGDDVLREVAAVLAESIRLVDTAGRWGGDEFALVAPGSAGTTVARRILDGIAKLPEVHGRRVSVSAGVARFPVDGATSEDLLAAAERALDAARQGGPGRIGEPAAAR